MKKIFMSIALLLLSMTFVACNSGAVVTGEDSAKIVGISQGNLAPGFSGVDIDGNVFSLDSFKENEKPTIILFFATWCPHCTNEFRTLNEVYEEYDESINMLAFSIEASDSKEELQEYRSQFSQLSKLPFSTLNERATQEYQVRFTTTKYVIGSDGVILYRGSGELTKEQWRTLFDAALES